MDRDKQRIYYILKHYSELQKELNDINDDFNEFVNNLVYQKAIKLDVIQIGEHTTNLSNERKNMIRKEDVRGVIDYRNQVVHGYVTIRNEELWNTIHNDLPKYIEQVKNLNLI